MAETAAASKSDTLRIEVRLPKWLSVITIVGCVLLVILSIAVFVLAYISNNTAQMVVQAAGVGLFGFWGLVAIRRMRQPGGALEISDRGITMQCYSFSPFSGPMGAFYCVGFVPWQNFAGVGITKAWMMASLGISVSDVDSFLKTGDQVSNIDAAWNVKQGEQSAGILWALMAMEPFVHVSDLVLRFVGYTGMPKSDAMKDSLEWNRNNWDHHIVIWGRIIDGGPAKLAELIKARAEKGSAPCSATRAIAALEADGKHPSDHEKPSIEASLSTLEDLFHKGLLTEDEYHRKREEIIARL